MFGTIEIKGCRFQQRGSRFQMLQMCKKKEKEKKKAPLMSDSLSIYIRGARTL